MNKPYRIALINQYDQGWVAGTEYIKNIILGLSSLPDQERNTFEIYLITKKPIDNKLLKTIGPCVKKTYFVENIIGAETFSKQFQRQTASILLGRPYYKYESFLKSSGFDFIYPFFSASNDEALKRSAAWIYDFQHKYLKQYFSKKEIIARNRYFNLIARHAPTIVLSSRCAQQDFIRFFPHAAPKSRVLPFRAIPSSEYFEGNPKVVQNKYSLPDRFFIVCNQFWRHKNHRTIIEALSLLKGEGVYPIIVCTGHTHDFRQPKYYDSILTTIHDLGLQQQIFILGLIPKVDQIQLLRRSIAVIQPSLFEGWSTIVEEARSFGKPIILSDIPVHIEQNPPNSLYFDPDSPESLSRHIKNWWKNLSPGPDPTQESTTIETNKKEGQIFAKTFLEISRGNNTKPVRSRSSIERREL